MTPPDSPLDLDAIEKRAQAATPGPWTPGREEFDSHAAMARAFEQTAEKGGHVLHYLEHEQKVYPAFTGNGPTSKANAAFIAAARTDVPALVAAVRERDRRIAELEQAAEEDLENLRDVLAKIEDGKKLWPCFWCGQWSESNAALGEHNRACKKNPTNAERDAAVEDARRLKEAMQLDSPFPLPSVLGHLINATNHLLATLGCDADGWETWHTALCEATKILAALSPHEKGGG